MIRTALILLTAALPVFAQAGGSVLLIADREASEVQLAELRRGVEAGLKAFASGMRYEVADPSALQLKEAFPDARAVLAFVPTERLLSVSRFTQERKIPLFDLGLVRHPRAMAIDVRPSLAEQVESTAYWVFGPFAHHKIALRTGRAPEDKEWAKLFLATAKAQYQHKSVEGPSSIGGRVESVAKDLERDVASGVSAFVASCSPEEGRILAAAAKTLPIPPVVVLASAALGFEPIDKKLGYVPFPEGAVVMDMDLPGPDVLKAWPDLVPILTLVEGPLALRATEMVQMLGQNPGDPDVRSGVPPNMRSFRLPSKVTPTTLHQTPLMATGKGWIACAPNDPNASKPRPQMQGYDPESGFGTFSRWSTLHFRAHPDTIVCEFAYSDGKQRTIEEDLAKLKILTEGRYPVIDHLIREKLMARMLSVTGEKFGHQSDGSLNPGQSFQISMVARTDKAKVKRKWPCYISGDDPAAGGRAFGGYCFVYSSFIRRTIFEKFDLFEEPVNPQDLPTLTGVGEEEGPYVIGSRRDVIFRIIDNYAGSMALTAAHEIGHLASLGHDEDDPFGLMNVNEGAGIRYQDGRFTPNNCAVLEKTLGRVIKEKPKR